MEQISVCFLVYFQYTDTCSLIFRFVSVELQPSKHGCPNLITLRRMGSYSCLKDNNSGMPWTVYREQLFTYNLLNFIFINTRYQRFLLRRQKLQHLKQKKCLKY